MCRSGCYLKLFQRFWDTAQKYLVVCRLSVLRRPCNNEPSRFPRVRQVQDALDVIVAHSLMSDILTAPPLQLGVVTDVCGMAGNGAHFDADAYTTSMNMTRSYRANGNFVSRTWCFARSARADGKSSV